jgi:pseudomonalisin
MHSHILHRTKSLLSVLLVLTGILSLSAQAQRVINDADRVVLHGNTHPLARAEFDRGSAPAAMPMDHMIMLLSVRADAQPQLDQLLKDQQSPASPGYHKWLTPAEFGLKFGPTDQDITDVTGWLSRFGFAVDEVSNGRMWINFSGDVQKVERAFQTNIRQYEVNGKLHHANATDPSIPRALTPLVQGLVSLNDFGKHPNSTVTQLPPDFTNATDGSHFLAPGDFATIYDVNPLYNAAPAIDGTGQTIAIVGRTEIQLADVQFFRSFFGLPAKDPVFIINGTDPGDLGGAEEAEADLDVEWAGAVARNATIDLVISQSTATTDGVDLSAQYIVNNNLAPVMSTSFGLCEAALGTTGNSFWNTLWAQAATQGITAFVSAGDSGAAGCDASNALNGSGLGVNGLASTPNNIAVGGTEFNEASGTFWNATNNPDQSSALGYIPESTWNESGNVGGSGLLATGGGASTIYAKPAWQTGFGVPADALRDLPDVSLSSAQHDGYLIVQGHTATISGLAAAAGTSAASPSFAGIMALLVQKTASAQGNADPIFYSMGNNQFNNGTGVYHDVTIGDNSVPGVTGFIATVGYDQATGWGSPDVSQLVNFWNNNAGPTDFSINAAPSSRMLAQNASTTFTFTVVPVNNYTGTVTFSVSGLPAGATASFAPASVTTSGSTVMTVTTVASPLGTYTLTVTGFDGTVGHTSQVTLIVANPDFSLSATPASQSVLQGSSVNYSVTLTPLNQYAGTVSFSVSGLPTGATGAFTPASLTTSGTTTLAIATVATTPAGTYPLTISGTDGILTHTASVTLIVSPVDFSVSAAPSSQSANQGTTATYTVTQTAINGYAGTVTYSVTSALPAGVSVAFTPATVAGSGTTSMAVTSSLTTPTGSYTLTISGTDGTLTHTATVTLVVTTPDFSLSVAPSSVTAAQGTTASYNVTLNPLNGYSGTVSLSVAGLPVGATATFTPATLTGSGSSALAVVLPNPAQPGSYPLTITGTDGTLTHTASATLVVSTPDFSLSATPSSQTINQGASSSYSITLTPLAGYTGTVSFAVSGLPAGATGSFNPVSLITSGSTALNIATATTTIPGTYALTITGSDGVLTHTTSVTLVITPAGDFSLSSTIASQTVTQGQNTGYGINVTSINGFSGTVALSISGLPTDATGTFNPGSITGAGTANLSVTTASTTPAGTYNLVITGTSGAIVHSITVQLIVNPTIPADFSLSSSPAITVKRGKTGSQPVTVTGSNGFTGTVSLAITGVPSGVTATLNPTSIAGGSGSSTLTLSVSNQMKQGNYPMTITGTSGALIHSISVVLTVN